MRAKLIRLHSVFFLFAFVVAGSAFATSLGKTLASSSPVCQVTAKFIEAKVKDGKILWVFDQLGEKSPSACKNLNHTFQVLIPSGSYSTLSHTNVYPVSISEPSPGDEVSLQLRYFGIMGWLLASEPDAIKGVR